MCFQLNFTKTFHFGIPMFSKLTASRITTTPYPKPLPLPARRVFIAFLWKQRTQNFAQQLGNYVWLFCWAFAQFVVVVIITVVCVGQSLPFVAAAQLYKCLFRGISDELSFDGHSKLGLLRSMHTFIHALDIDIVRFHYKLHFTKAPSSLLSGSAVQNFLRI